ncbi:MAG: pyridoxal-phosphate dependent enzyme, partial [Pseudomonadota bacterium]
MAGMRLPDTALSSTRAGQTVPVAADVDSAYERIRQTVIHTPLVASALSTAEREILLKLECVQETGAFKLRGALAKITTLPADARHVVCASTGNHGRAVAWAARHTGRQATVCLSSLVPPVKVSAVQALGASVRRIGRSQDEAQEEVDRMVAQGEAVEVPPFDDPSVIAGQGTIALEILRVRPDVKTLLVPLSGGGLIAGIAL